MSALLISCLGYTLQLTLFIASELYRLLMKSVAEAHKEIQDFKELMSDAESKKVLERAKKSHKDNPRGIVPWDPVEHPNWFANGSS